MSDAVGMLKMVKAPVTQPRHQESKVKLRCVFVDYIFLQNFVLVLHSEARDHYLTNVYHKFVRCRGRPYIHTCPGWDRACLARLPSVEGTGVYRQYLLPCRFVRFWAFGGAKFPKMGDSLSCIIDQRKIPFLKKIQKSIVQSVFCLTISVGKITSKYYIQTLGFSTSIIRSLMWKHFLDWCVMNQKISVTLCSVLLWCFVWFLSFLFRYFTLVCCAASA